MIRLVAAADADFLWMLGQAPPPAGLRPPPGGVDDAAVLTIVRRMAARLAAAFGPGCWMMVAHGEVVGLCSYKAAPDAAGQVEIGYGVAAARRGRGHAGAAVAALAAIAADDPRITALIAETALDNIASQRVLARNGFARTGERTDPEDGPLVLWRRALGR